MDLDTIRAMSGKSVLVAGDIMLDRFIYGDVERISPESPVPVLSVRRQDRMLGGAGNVIANLAGLKIKPLVVAVIGEDADGESVREMVRSLGGETSGLVPDPERPTTVKTRYLASHQQLLRTDEEKAGPVTGTVEADILNRAERLLTDAGALVLSDYGKGVLTDRVIQELVRLAGEREIPVLVDPKGTDYTRYKGADVITPNRKELSEGAGGMPTVQDSEVVSAARRIIEQAGIGAVVATRSQDGMSVIRRTPDGNDFEAPEHLRTQALEVFDVSGAGDTVIATLAASMAAGAGLLEAARLANLAGGIAVSKVGTTPVRASELEEALTGAGNQVSRQGRICTAEEAAEHVRRWQAQGLKVGFTNGCFDLVHAGHVTYLNAARGQCDRLVLGLNADESVRRLKGSSRPVNDEISRATVMAALGSVDMVVIFGKSEDEQDMPVSLISALRPDIHFKGGDYTIDQLPEAKAVLSYGGSVKIMSLEEGHSTTDMIARAKG